MTLTGYRAKSKARPVDATIYPDAVSAAEAHGVTITRHTFPAPNETPAPAPAPVPSQPPPAPSSPAWMTRAVTPALGSINAPPTMLGLMPRLFPGRNVYSQLQPFSPSGGHVLVWTRAGYELRKISGELVSKRPNTPRWLLNGNVVSLSSDGYLEHGIETLTRLPLGVAIETGPSSEEPARNGLMAALSTAGDLLVIDGLSAAIKARKRLPALPNWVAMSPSGAFAVVQYNADGTGDGKGVCVYSMPTLAFVRQLVTTHHHGDLGVVAGRDVYWTIQHNPPENNNYPAIVFVDVATGARKYVRSIAWGAFEHVSAKGPDGWALVSGDTKMADRPLSGDLWAVRDDGATVRIAEHGAVGTDYWDRPMASWSPSGLVLFGEGDAGKLIDLGGVK